MLAHGADKSLTNFMEYTALDFAKAKGNHSFYTENGMNNKNIKQTQLFICTGHQNVIDILTEETTTLAKERCY